MSEVTQKLILLGILILLKFFTQTEVVKISREIGLKLLNK